MTAHVRPIGGVIVSHGQLATELLSAAETIVGSIDHITAVSIGWHDDVDIAREEIARSIDRVDRGGGVLILTDMFGGTPTNIAATFLGTERPVEIITGAMQRPEGAALRSELVAALTADEFVTPLAPVLHKVQQEAVKLLTSSSGADVVTPDPAGASPGGAGLTVGGVASPPGQVWQGRSLAEARAKLDALADDVAAGVVDASTIHVQVTWAEGDTASGEAGE